MVALCKLFYTQIKIENMNMLERNYYKEKNDLACAEWFKHLSVSPSRFL